MARKQKTNLQLHAQLTFKLPKITDDPVNTSTIENEIECPTCRDVMTLCSDFDLLYYLCQECNFCLYTSRRF